MPIVNGPTTSSLTVAEVDGTPSLTATTLVVSNGSLTDSGGGTATVVTGAGGGGSVVFMEEGSAVGTGTILNFVGAGVTATFSGGTAIATISGGTAGTTVASDTIWDAAGDLAVGSGADTAARLAIGAAGGAVSRVNGAVAWNSGTAFPTAATGDRYWRTDLGLECYYDGTRWLSTNEYTLGITTRVAASATGYAATTTIGNAPTRGSDGDMFVVDFRCVTYITSGNSSGSHYWTITLDSLTGANAATNLGSITTAANTVATWTTVTDPVDAVVAGSTEKAFRVIATVTLGTPGPLFIGVEVTYRLIAT